MLRRNKYSEIVNYENNKENIINLNNIKSREYDMKENIFNTEVVRSLKLHNYFAYKISDVMGSRFTETKPCDILSCSPNGVFIAIESKQIKKWSGLTGRMLRDNQITTLDKAVKNKSKAFVLLNIRLNGKQRENWCVVFNWKEHRENIMKGKYTAKVLQDGYVGEWRLSSKVEDKIIWDIKDLETL